MPQNRKRYDASDEHSKLWSQLWSCLRLRSSPVLAGFRRDPRPAMNDLVDQIEIYGEFYGENRAEKKECPRGQSPTSPRYAAMRFSRAANLQSELSASHFPQMGIPIGLTAESLLH